MDSRPDEIHYTGCSPFQDVPTAVYWSMTTITTVGYGDTYPVTLQGRLVASVCMVCGILSVALPTTVLGVEFSNVFEMSRLDRARAAGRKRMMELQKDELELIEVVKKFDRVKNDL